MKARCHSEAVCLQVRAAGWVQTREFLIHLFLLGDIVLAGVFEYINQIF